MKLKIKYRHAKDRGEWSRKEKTTLDLWNRICLALALIMGVCTLVGYGSARIIDLGQPNPEGFVVWFMLCCAYPVLSLLGLINSILGSQDSTLMRFLVQEHQLLGLALINGSTLLLLWLGGRFAALRWLGALPLRVAAHFLMIIAGWGLFQLFLFGASAIWQSGGFQPLHANWRRIETVQPRPVPAAPPAESPRPAAARPAS